MNLPAERVEDLEEDTGGRAAASGYLVLVVEDDPPVRDVVRRYLERDGHRVSIATDGASALDLVAAEPPDLVVLDLMLPDISGLDVCRHLRETSSVPVLVLTALGEESDRILGLEVGADDYVCKPFSPRELALRVSSVLRRAAGNRAIGGAPGGDQDPEQLPLLSDGDLVLDSGTRVATRGGRVCPLTSREFDLLTFLVGHPAQVYSREQLLDLVWGWSFGDLSTVTVHVKRLRAKIEDDPVRPSRIVTVWGHGYRYDPAGSS